MNHISKIIIIGTNHHNTLSMVRSFGEEGQKVDLYIYGANSSYIASSIYVSNVLYFRTALEAIKSIPLDASNKPLVIACSDEVSSLMDLQYDSYINGCFFFNAGGNGIITSFMDKQKQLIVAKECGFCIPKSIDILPNIVLNSDISFPCILKPKASINGGKKISICRDVNELKKKLNDYDSRYNILVQDYIQKDFEIVILGLSVDDVIIIPGFIQKHREDKGGTTYSTVKPIIELSQDIVKACKKLIKTIGYQGLWGIECIKQGETFFFLEINLRNDATTYALKVAGVNLPFIYQQLVENPDEEVTVNQVQKINSMVEFNDFNFVLKGQVSLFRWLYDLRKAKCRYYYSNSDRYPFLLCKKEYVIFLRKRILKF